MALGNLTSRGATVDIDQEKVEEMVLALLNLTSFENKGIVRGQTKSSLSRNLCV